MIHSYFFRRSVRDSAALLDATAGYCPGDPNIAPVPARHYQEEVGAQHGRLRIGVALHEAAGQRFHPDAAAAVATAAPGRNRRRSAAPTICAPSPSRTP
jgi:amidase